MRNSICQTLYKADRLAQRQPDVVAAQERARKRREAEQERKRAAKDASHEPVRRIILSDSEDEDEDEDEEDEE